MILFNKSLLFQSDKKLGGQWWATIQSDCKRSAQRMPLKFATCNMTNSIFIVYRCGPLIWVQGHFKKAVISGGP